MGIVLDTHDLNRNDRAAAFAAAIDSQTQPTRVAIRTGVAPIHHVIEAWDLAGSMKVLKVTGTRHETSRGPQQLRAAADERIAVLVRIRGNSRLTHLGAEHSLSPGSLSLLDQTSATSMSDGDGCLKAVTLDFAQLGLPVDLVRRAAPLLRHSPVYQLVARHLAVLCENGSELPPGPAQTMVTTATLELVRALVLSALKDDPLTSTAADGMDAILETYLLQHLSDHDLSPATIARAHNISVRQLYKVWARKHGVPLSQWILTARLEGARAELAQPSNRRSITAVAARWHFTNGAHFSRRFRQAYGMAPREWRDHHTPLMKFVADTARGGAANR